MLVLEKEFLRRKWSMHNFVAIVFKKVYRIEDFPSFANRVLEFFLMTAGETVLKVDDSGWDATRKCGKNSLRRSQIGEAG
jgi:hypothetical protein